MVTPILDATSFWDQLSRRVVDTPERTLLIDDRGRSMTCGAFLDAVERVAAGFAAMGIGEGTPVTWILLTRI